MLLLPVLFVCACTSQDPSTDVGELPEQGIEEVFFTALHKQTYEDPQGARETSLLVLDTLDPADKVSEIKLLKYIGSSYVFETNYPEAISYYTRALSLAEKINDYNEMANLNNNLGMIYNELGNFKTSYTYYLTALEQYDLAGSKDKKIGTLNNIGVIYLNLNNYEKAKGYFEQALDPTIHYKDTILVASVLNNLAICYSEKQPERALEQLNRGIALSEDVNNQYGLCISYQIMGAIYKNSGDHKRSLEAFTTSTQIAETAHLPHQLAIAQVGVANALLSMDQTEEALAVAFGVMQTADEKESLVLQREGHQILSDVYEKLGDYKNSLYHFREHVKAQRELINQTVVNQIYDVEVTHLSQLNKMQQLEIETKALAISNKNTWLFFVSLVFTLILIGFYLAYRNHRHKQHVQFQKTVVELTKKKSYAALEAEIQERKRIGQELHDSLGYLLSLAGLHASVLEKRKDLSEAKKKELLKSLMESIDEAFDEVRTISHNLAPSLLSEHGLRGALKNISDRINQSSTLKMSYDTFGLNGKQDELIENVLYRTIQEIVNNTITHAEATELFIQITQDPNQITLIAEDNGKGFDVAAVSEQSSFGLSHIKSGIENLNGTLFIDSKKGRGTISSIFIPLKN